jgi:AAA ATPase domain/Adenylate and Guanylate cyclase catalytic domain
MQEAIRRYSEEMRRGHGVEVQIRVGLNSGEVVVRAIGNDLHMDYSAIGQTTHLAARMEQLAPPGNIRLTADTVRLAEGWVQVTPLGPVPVKGLSAPVEVYELVGAGPARTRLQTFAARGLTPFVGRQAELAALHQALEQAGAGHGQVIAVIGEPAVGKTRLFYEFTHAARTQGWLLLESSSTSYGKATPYLPVIDLLKAYFQIEDRDDARRIREKLTGRLLTLDSALGPSLPAFLALLEVPVEDTQWQALDPSQRRQRTLDALKRLLLRESQVQPLLLVFENLHWIDTETQAFLDGLVESLPAARLLLLVNYRPEYQHGWGTKTYYTLYFRSACVNLLFHRPIVIPYNSTPHDLEAPMNPVAPVQAEQALAQLAHEFDHWRQIRTNRAAPIPPPLWEQAIALTALLPRGQVAKRLRLSGGELKKRCAAPHAPRSAPASPAALDFVELPAPPAWPLSPPPVEVELQRADGARLRIHYHEATLPVAALVRTFLETR